MSQPLYKGTCDNQRQPEGSKTVGDTIARQVVIKGKKTTLETLQTSTYMKGVTFETDWIVASTVLQELAGYMAKLTINLIYKGTTTEGYPDPVSIVDVWEINWSSIEKPLLECNKLYGEYAKPAEGEDSNVAQRQEIADEVSAWRDSPQQRKRKYQIPVATLDREPVANVDADWVALSATAEKIARKMAKGVEGYLVFSPIITKTQVFSVMPNTGGCGTIDTPTVNIAGYVYLKNGDRAIQQQDKTWTRTESWQGADEWDTDLYGA